jgi:hypothetical protein
MIFYYIFFQNSSLDGLLNIFTDLALNTINHHTQYHIHIHTCKISLLFRCWRIKEYSCITLPKHILVMGRTVQSEKLLHSLVILSSTPRHERGFELTTSVVIGSDCIGSYKSNYYAITTTMAPSNCCQHVLVFFCSKEDYIHRRDLHNINHCP